MKLITRAILIVLSMPLVVFAQDDAETDEPPSDGAQELSPAELQEFLLELAEEEEFVELPTHTEGDGKTQNYSGEWIEENGVRYCDGYLTRNAREEYCSKDIPKDWRPFEFDGQTFFVAPIQTDDE